MNCDEFTMKRPMIGESYLRQLLHPRPYDASHFYSRFTSNDSFSFYQEGQECAKIDAVVSDSYRLMSNDIVTGADQLRAGNGIKDHSNETTRAPTVRTPQSSFPSQRGEYRNNLAWRC